MFTKQYGDNKKAHLIALNQFNTFLEVLDNLSKKWYSPFVIYPRVEK